MKRLGIMVGAAIVAAALSTVLAQTYSYQITVNAAQTPPAVTVKPQVPLNRKTLPLGSTGKHITFHDRHAMKKGHPLRRFKHPFGALAAAFPPAPALPIDYARKLQFPMYGNDAYGDCMYAAAAHAYGSQSGCVRTEYLFNTADLIKSYLKLSGGDNGLNEGDILTQWVNPGLVDNNKAVCYQSMDIDSTDASLMQSAIYFFGGVLFMFDCPEKWVVDFTPGMTWEIQTVYTAAGGHGVWINGVNAKGQYHVQTWGSDAWLNPPAIPKISPSAFTVFCPGFFSDAGLAPNGLTYDQVGGIWLAGGGAGIPANPFPSYT